MPADKTIIAQTRAWVSSVVIGLNFCPFAKREFDNETIRYAVSVDANLETALLFVDEECKRLDAEPDIETTLMIFPSSFEKFDDFLELIVIAEALLVELGYEGTYQLASFHPDYVFDSTNKDDPSNYTNRSPYPTLHLLREASLERAIASYGDVDAIPEKNVECARSLGEENLKALLTTCYLAN